MLIRHCGTESIGLLSGKNKCWPLPGFAVGSPPMAFCSLRATPLPRHASMTNRRERAMSVENNVNWVQEWLQERIIEDQIKHDREEQGFKDEEKAEEKDELIDRLAFSIYRGQDFAKFQFKPKEFLIDSMVHRGDTVMLIGSPKSGKSLFIKQMICSLTSAHQFLGKFPVNESTKVCYVQLEGEPADTQDRFVRLAKSCSLRWENLSVYYSSPLFLQDKNEVNKFIKMVELGANHDVIILDGLYLCFSGSLSDDTVVRQLIGNLRVIKNYFNATLILVHHTHKVRFNQDGEAIAEGDEAVFGSQFLRAWPDHIFHLSVQKNSDIRHLQCSTQRSGMIETDIKMKLVQPDPLYFETLDEIPKGVVMENWKEKILAYIDGTIAKRAHGFEIRNAIGIPNSTFYRAIGDMILNKILFKEGEGKNSVYYNTRINK